jgi:hypothetical protein
MESGLAGRVGRSQSAAPHGEPTGGERRRARQTSRRALIPRPETPGDTEPNTVAELGRIPETRRDADGWLGSVQRTDGGIGPCDEATLEEAKAPVSEGGVRRVQARLEEVA